MAGRGRNGEPTQSERPAPPAKERSSAPRRATTRRPAVQSKAQTPTAPDWPARRAPKPSSPPPPAPATYAGRYELIGLLGVGAMGSVYRAHDLLLGETVALKVLRKDLANAPLAVSRFHREAKLARRVTHPNITRVYDVAEHDGEHYLTMECVEGDSLHTMLDGGRPLPIARAISIALQLARALAAAHEKGIVHCDLKPENVVVEPGGRAVLTDFGVSKVERDGAPPPLPGHAGGTPIYMAPEQLEGRSVDARTDLYALGLLLYEMLTGRTPWGRRGGIAGSVARLAVPPKSPRELEPRIPEPLAALTMRLLEREMSARPESARAVEAALEALSGAVEDRPSAPIIATRKLSTPAPSMRPPSAIATTATPNTRGIAVLPLRNLGNEKTQYVTDALTTALVDRLAAAPTLRVASRAAIEAHERANDDLRALGRRLGVESIVEGSLLVRPGNEMRLSVRLVEVERGFVLWSKRIDRSAKDLFKVADEVVTEVAKALGVDASAGSVRPRASPASTDSVDPFLRAQDALGEYTAEGARAAEQYLAEAFLRAPKDPLLASWLAIAKLRRWTFEPALGQGDEAAPVVAERIALEVLKKSGNVGEAHLALATLADHRGDPVEAMRRAREAVRCTPTLAEAHRIVGRLTSEAATTFEGERDLDVSLRLDPQQVYTMLLLARTRALKRDFERAAEWLKLAEARSPGHVACAFGRVQLASWKGDGNSESARAAAATKGRAGLYAHAIRAFSGLGEDIEVGKLAALAAAPGTTSRVRAMIMQIICEQRVRAKDAEGALSALRSVDAAGSVDLLWLERCPSLEGIRGFAGWSHLRASIATRAAETLAAGRVATSDRA